MKEDFSHRAPHLYKSSGGVFRATIFLATDDLGAVELAASLSPAEVDAVLAAHPDRRRTSILRHIPGGPYGRFEPEFNFSRACSVQL